MHKMDDRQIYVVRANGCVVTGSSNRWFRNGVDLKTGDTIVVPLDTEHMSMLPLWQVLMQRCLFCSQSQYLLSNI